MLLVVRGNFGYMRTFLLDGGVKGMLVTARKNFKKGKTKKKKIERKN
jgi:hypothetical protein